MVQSLIYVFKIHCTKGEIKDTAFYIFSATTRLINSKHGNQKFCLLLPSSVLVAVVTGILCALGIACRLCKPVRGGVKPRPINQVVEVAVVGAIVKNGIPDLRGGVTLW